MGTICIFLGIIFLIVFTAGGVLLSNSILANSLYMSLLGMSSASTIYLVVVGACFVVGLLISESGDAWLDLQQGLQDRHENEEGQVRTSGQWLVAGDQ